MESKASRHKSGLIATWSSLKSQEKGKNVKTHEHTGQSWKEFSTAQLTHGKSTG